MTATTHQVLAGTLIGAILIAAGVWTYRTRMDVGPPVDTGRVVLELNDFVPDHVGIRTGTTVTWTWQNAAHDLVFADGTTVALRETGTWERTFTEPGSYDYRCTLHGPMRGRVTVTPTTS